MTATTKKCLCCKKVKPLTEFGKRHEGETEARCKDCNTLANRQYKVNQPRQDETGAWWRCCVKCNQEYPWTLDYFYPHTGGERPGTMCKPCRRTLNREYEQKVRVPKEKDERQTRRDRFDDNDSRNNNLYRVIADPLGVEGGFRRGAIITSAEMTAMLRMGTCTNGMLVEQKGSKRYQVITTRGTWQELKEIKT